MLAISNPACLLAEDRPGSRSIRSSSFFFSPPQWPAHVQILTRGQPAIRNPPARSDQGAFLLRPFLAPKDAHNRYGSQPRRPATARKSDDDDGTTKPPPNVRGGRGKRSDSSLVPPVCCPNYWPFLRRPEPPDARAPPPAPRREDRIQSMTRSMVALIDLLAREAVAGWLLRRLRTATDTLAAPQQHPQQIQTRRRRLLDT